MVSLGVVVVVAHAVVNRNGRDAFHLFQILRQAESVSVPARVGRHVAQGQRILFARGRAQGFAEVRHEFLPELADVLLRHRVRQVDVVQYEQRVAVVLRPHQLEVGAVYRFARQRHEMARYYSVGFHLVARGDRQEHIAAPFGGAKSVGARGIRHGHLFAIRDYGSRHRFPVAAHRAHNIEFLGRRRPERQQQTERRQFFQEYDMFHRFTRVSRGRFPGELPYRNARPESAPRRYCMSHVKAFGRTTVCVHLLPAPSVTSASTLLSGAEAVATNMCGTPVPGKKALLSPVTPSAASE